MSNYLGFEKDGAGVVTAVVVNERKEVVGRFLLDKDNPLEVKKAELLGIDMGYACYAYEYKTASENSK